MKRILVAVLVSLLFLTPARAQEPIRLPFITKGHVPECVEDDVSYWRIIIPEATTNYVLNPSAEETGNFGAVGGGAMTRSSTYSWYGLYSYRIQTSADNDGGSLTLSALSNDVHYVTLLVRETLPASWDWSLDGAIYNVPTLIAALDADWSLYGHQFPAAQANASVTLEIRQNGAGAGDFYIDGVQAEPLSYWTTYADGDQEGCTWNGAEHASTSTRSALSPAGGRQYDLQTDYAFDIGGQIGTGTAPQSVVVDEYAILPGGELNVVKVHPRRFTLTGVVRGDSYSDLHGKTDDLTTALLTNPQPVRLRYTGSTAQKEIAAHYEQGMEGNIVATDPCHWQRMALRFVAPDPYFYKPGGSGTGGAGDAMLLDTNDDATFRIVAGRLRDTGQWDELGPPGAPGTAVYNWAHAIAEDDTYIYYGGNFLDFDNQGNADHIVRYNKQTSTWSPLGTGMNNAVYALTVGPDGTLYAGGNFTSAGGVPNTNRYAAWNGTNWVSLGTLANGDVYTLAFGHDGLLYAGGGFTSINGIVANYIASYDGAVWAALGVGTDADVIAIAFGPDGVLYAGGDFLNAGGAGANRIASWDGSAWSNLGTGLNNSAYFIAVSSNNIVYVGGGFTTAGGVTVNYIAEWNGTAWTDLAGGTNGNVRSLAIGGDGILYAGGAFSSAGGIDLADRVAQWNGSSWAHLDINLPGTPLVYEMLCSDPDPVISSNYDLWLAFSTTGTGYFAGTAIATNNGTREAYPVIIFERSGGTSATIESVRNETTGKRLYFDYDLLDGERLTVDLRPTRQSITSNFFGSVPAAILANSDMGSFVLQVGDNQITSFVNVAGVPTITAWIEWRTSWSGL